MMRRMKPSRPLPWRALAIALVVVAWVAPVVWILATAFKPRADVYDLAILFEPTLASLRAAFESPYSLGSRLVNSLVVTAGTLIVAIPAATMAAYAFSRFRFPGGQVGPLLLLATQFLPPVIIVIPLFVVFRHLRMLDTHAALIIANLSFVVPYATWMIKAFFDALPTDMEEAAQIDGASRARAIEFFYALVLTRDAAVTLPVALMSARTEQGDAWDIMAGMGLFIVAPMLLVSRFVQRYFVRGLTAGAVR